MKDKSILISVGIIIYIVMSGIDRFVYHIPNAVSYTHLIEMEKPDGIIASLGGQTAINLANPLQERGVKPVSYTHLMPILMSDRKGR